MHDNSTNQQARCTLYKFSSPTVPFSLLDKGATLNLHTHTSTCRQVEPDAKMFVTQQNLYLYCKLHPILGEIMIITVQPSLAQAHTPCWLVVLGLFKIIQ